MRLTADEHKVQQPGKVPPAAALRLWELQAEEGIPRVSVGGASNMLQCSLRDAQMAILGRRILRCVDRYSLRCAAVSVMCVSRTFQVKSSAKNMDLQQKGRIASAVTV